MAVVLEHLDIIYRYFVLQVVIEMGREMQRITRMCNHLLLL
jgi:hypothetical protein